jgi:hypothetical protein
MQRGNNNKKNLHKFNSEWLQKAETQSIQLIKNKILLVPPKETFREILFPGRTASQQHPQAYHQRHPTTCSQGRLPLALLGLSDSSACQAAVHTAPVAFGAKFSPKSNLGVH